ncbi:MAG: rhomboid family intramembrane serine protease [Arcobacteraceae bacterium]
MQNNKIFTLTNIIIVLTILMYVVQTNIQHGDILLGLNLNFTENNLYYQPLSTIFTHGGIAHLFMNMFVLYQFGNLIERYRGKAQFIFLYLVGGVLTSLGSFAFIYSLGLYHNLVGASGAICVLLGYVALVDKNERKGIITWVVVISIFPVLLGLPVAWYAHFIGFAIGFILGSIKK